MERFSRKVILETAVQPQKTQFLASGTSDTNKDMNESATLEIRGIKKSALTGALTEVFKNTEKQQKSSNIFIRLLSELYNYLVSMTPLGYALSPTSIGS